MTTTVRLLATYDGSPPQTLRDLPDALAASFVAQGNASLDLTGGARRYQGAATLSRAVAQTLTGAVTLLPNQKTEFSVPESTTLNLVTSKSTTGAVQYLNAAGDVTKTQTVSGETAFKITSTGAGTSVRIFCDAGSIAITPKGTTGVSASGFSAGIVRTSFALFDVSPFEPNKYVGVDQNLGGFTGVRLMEYTFAPADAELTAPIAVKQLGIMTALTPAAGGSTMGGNISIFDAWYTSSGAIFCLVYNGTTGFHHLAMTSKTRAANQFGANNTGVASTSNTDQKAVFDFGARLGVQYQNIRTLHHRGLCEVTPNNGAAKFLLLAEYNINQPGSTPPRSSGSVGPTVQPSANDFVRCLRSNDEGYTWSTFIEFNMNSVTPQHYSNHFHGVVQNLFSGIVYFMSGDNKPAAGAGNEQDQRFILSWDGMSPAPALNSSPADFAALPGWGLLKGSELYRSADMLFSPTRGYYLCDADSEAADTGSLAFAGMVCDPALAWGGRVECPDRVTNVPPILACKTPSGASYFMTFRNADASAPNEHRVYATADEGITWRLAARLPLYGSATTTSTPSNMMYDPNTKKILLSGLPSARACRWAEGAATTAATYVFSPSETEADAQPLKN